MDDASLASTMKRLGEKERPLLDERFREAPLQEEPEPLFNRRRDAER